MKSLLVGGTHGNEWTGVYSVEKWKGTDLFDEYLISNPEAFDNSVRFNDEDLNRCFGDAELAKKSVVTKEMQIADKLKNYIKDFELLVDLHTTTSNMGKTVIFSKFSQNMFSLLSYLMDTQRDIKAIFNPDPNKDYMISQVDVGIVVEVGPVANASLDAKVFRQTNEIVEAVGEWLKLAEKPTYNKAIEYYKYERKIPYQKNTEGKLVTMVSENWQSMDFRALPAKASLLTSIAGEPIEFNDLEGLYPIFINEAAYYRYGYAMQLVSKQLWEPGE